MFPARRRIPRWERVSLISGKNQDCIAKSQINDKFAYINNVAID